MHMAFRAAQRTDAHRETSVWQAAPPALTEGRGRGLRLFHMLVAPWLFVHVSLHVFMSFCFVKEYCFLRLSKILWVFLKFTFKAIFQYCILILYLGCLCSTTRKKYVLSVC